MRIVRRPSMLCLLFATLLGHAGLCAAQDDRNGYAERVAAEHEGDRPTGNVSAENADVISDTRAYATLDGEPVNGYLARPRDGAAPYPAVLLIHEWWGLNDHIRAMARRFADNGFVALAVDLYEGRSASTPGKARKLMQRAMEQPERLRRNLEQAYFYLDLMPSTQRIASVGWCFGGGWSLRTALMFPQELDASVIYYGELVTDPERLQPLQVPILGLFGSADTTVPPQRARAFERVLTELEKPHEIHVYAGAAHAFANPSGEAYDRDAAKRAWAETMAFLRTHLAAEPRGSE